MKNNDLTKQRIHIQIIIRVAIITLTISGFIMIVSCEGYRCGEGIVYDSQTNLPLDSVLCKVSKGDEKVYTDSTGKYNLCNPFGGCVPDCPDIVIEFSKTGYKSQKVTNPNKSDIYLEKE